MIVPVSIASQCDPSTCAAPLPDFSFRITHRPCDLPGAARCGVLTLPHAAIPTPAFMPVGTHATVKGATPLALAGMGYRLILANAYHLSLRPGADLVSRMGGLHRFMGWPSAILTDSGGFQVFSLAALRKTDADGVTFQSHIDGSTKRFTAETVMRCQQELGADIAMVFDDCAGFPSSDEQTANAMERTHRWAQRCQEVWDSAGRRAVAGHNQALFGIVQGGVSRELREYSARAISRMEFDGNAIGGLAVGEPKETRNAAIGWCTALLPVERPRYLMGVGTPEDILDAVGLGVDMFDCVLPTRNARNGQIFTSKGRVNLRNAQFAEDNTPLDPDCGCEVCRIHTRAYLRHLFQSKELLGPILATHHNLSFYGQLMQNIRDSIATDSFSAFKSRFLQRFSLLQPAEEECLR
ncbi:MAG TPA: tRNA guanosine(34) transglycosylase Tgt [Chthonomonadales bacterium]|nr:tRNA guanosine(34) transglycosylase Tgt [Chthonomonadales bacterium]